MTYVAVEEKAPTGYLLADPVTFTVPEEDKVLEVRIYDRKVSPPDKPGRDKPPPEPGKPKPPTEGTITVHYDDAIAGRGAIHLGNEKLTPIPGLGDINKKNRDRTIYIVAAILLGSGLLLYRRRRKGRRHKY